MMELESELDEVGFGCVSLGVLRKASSGRLMNAQGPHFEFDE